MAPFFDLGSLYRQHIPIHFASLRRGAFHFSSIRIPFVEQDLTFNTKFIS